MDDDKKPGMWFTVAEFKRQLNRGGISMKEGSAYYASILHIDYAAEVRSSNLAKPPKLATHVVFFPK